MYASRCLGSRAALQETTVILGHKLIELAINIGVALVVLALFAGIAWMIFKGLL